MTTSELSPAITDVVDDEAGATLLIEGVRKRFGSAVAVDGIDLSVGRHEIICLVGPSGCGKSTLLRMIGGLQVPDAGRIRLDGLLLDDGPRHTPPEKRGIGIVFQDHALFPNLTVGRNVAFGLAGKDRNESRRRVDEMLELVELATYRDRYPHELSGGERQRVALARALAPAPAVLLLDEPFASLDQNLRVQVRTEVLGILRSSGTPAVFVTHDQLEALALGDRVVVMRDGRIEQVGEPAAVFHRPASRFVAAFLGDADFVPAQLADGGFVETELGPCPAPDVDGTGGQLELVVRPDDVVIDPQGREAGRPGVLATVIAAEFQGARNLYALRLPSGRTIRLRCDQSDLVPVGSTVAVRLSDRIVPAFVSS